MEQTSTQFKHQKLKKFKKAITPNNHHHHHHHHHHHIIPYLPKELQEEIFNKVSLPIKTITEFQNLTNCTQISSIFSDPKFVQSQINNYTLPCILAYYVDRNNFFLIEGQNSKFLSTEINLNLVNPKNLEILNSCNGLLLLTDRQFLWVVNPLTREIISLPAKSNKRFCSGDKSYYFIGFSPKNEKYKVVRLVGSLSQAFGGYYLEFSWYAEVLTLGTDTWREINGCDLIFQNAILEDQGLAMINGALFWLIHLGNKHEIVRFDIDSEEFGLIPSPLDQDGSGSGSGSGFSLSSIGTVDNLLCVARYKRRSCYDGDLKNEIEIWVMRNSGVWSFWRKINVVYYENMRCVRKFELIKGSENDEEMLMMLQDPLKLVYYDTNKGTIREAPIDGVDCNKVKGIRFCPNMRSIITCN